MATNRIWIMDGHNMIFAIPPLQRLQVSGRREEARAGLVARLETFAVARGEKVLVVFDGNQSPATPGAIKRPLFEAAYTRRGEGVADVRILREARACFERGLVVTVITNDVSTLARNLPRGVRHLGVEEFWLEHLEKRRSGMDDGEGDKRVEGDFSDLERQMLEQAAMEEAFQPPDPGTPAVATGQEEMPDRLALKREKGRLRQERRLKRYAKPGRRQ